MYRIRKVNWSCDLKTHQYNSLMKEELSKSFFY